MSVVAVSVRRDEWEEALPLLKTMGLTHAAVTSPHKENAAKLCRHPTLHALNTLYWNKNQNMWQGISTDDAGFTELVERHRHDRSVAKRNFRLGRRRHS